MGMTLVMKMIFLLGNKFKRGQLENTETRERKREQERKRKQPKDEANDSRQESRMSLN